MEADPRATPHALALRAELLRGDRSVLFGSRATTLQEQTAPGIPFGIVGPGRAHEKARGFAMRNRSKIQLKNTTTAGRAHEKTFAQQRETRCTITPGSTPS